MIPKLALTLVLFGACVFTLTDAGATTGANSLRSKPSLQPGKAPYFGVRVVDADTGFGVPLVQLRTSHYINQYTDSAGYAAFFEPGLMNTSVWFSVLTDGYELVGGVPCTPTDFSPCDSGLVMVTSEGQIQTLEMKRAQISSRRFRLSGQGIYRDSYLLGLKTPIDHPLLDPTGLTGQDTLITCTYKGRAYWFFGDTVGLRSARQGNDDGYGMYTVGATSCLPSPHSRTCPPDQHPNLQYFGTTVDGVNYVKPMAPVLDTKQNTWVGGIFTIHKGEPNEAMYGIFFKPYYQEEHPKQNVYGLVKWNDATEQFDLAVVYPPTSPWWRSGNAVVSMFAPGDEDDYVYFTGVPVYGRVHQDHVEDVSYYEAFTPLAAGSSMRHPVMDPAGWTWKRNMTAFGGGEEAALIKLGLIKEEDARYQTVDSTTGEAVGLSGTIQYNKFLKKYVTLGPYLSVADSLTGPWKTGTKIYAHESTGSSCYNPQQVPYLNDAEMSDRTVFVACTYTSMWSNDVPKPPTRNLWNTCLFGQNSRENCSPVVPRYEYTNVVYSVDLAYL